MEVTKMIVNLPKKYFSVLTNSNICYLFNKITGEFYELYDPNIKILEQEAYFSVLSDDINILQNMLELANQTDSIYKQKKLDDRRILRLALNISQNCLLNCVYCYASSGTYGNSGIMSEEVFTKGIDFFLENFDVEGIQLFGGEPLLNLELVDMLFSMFSDQNTNSKIKLSLITSLCIPNEKLNKFTDILETYHGKINLEIVVSIDGPKIIHDSLRPQKNVNRKDSYEIVFENMKLLRKFQQPKAVEITYTMLHYRNNIKIKVFLTSLIKKFFSYDSDNIINYFCPAGLNSFIIDIEGNIYPCQLSIANNKNRIANLLIDTRSEIVDKIRKYRLEMDEYSNKEKYQECIQCYFTYTCSRCIYKEIGNIQTLFIQCEYERKLFELLIESNPWNLVNLLDLGGVEFYVYKDDEIEP